MKQPQIDISKTFDLSIHNKADYQNDDELRKVCVSISNFLNIIFQSPEILKKLNDIRNTVLTIVNNLRSANLQESADYICELLNKWDDKDPASTKLLILNLNAIKDSFIKKFPEINLEDNVDYMGIILAFDEGKFN